MRSEVHAYSDTREKKHIFSRRVASGEGDHLKIGRTAHLINNTIENKPEIPRQAGGFKNVQHGLELAIPPLKIISDSFTVAGAANVANVANAANVTNVARTVGIARIANIAVVANIDGSGGFS